jgi:catechol 2,3-dioxygenase-like lactoylglutathione lyase family enzyme
MKLTRILHASVNVEGCLDPARDFYSKLFQMQTAPRPDIPGVAGEWFTIGDAQLHLVDAPHRGAHQIDPTGPHVCFGVEDLDDAVRELEEQSVPYTRANQGEVAQIWVTDPSGFTIELQQDRRL